MSRSAHQCFPTHDTIPLFLPCLKLILARTDAVRVCSDGMQRKFSVNVIQTTLTSVVNCNHSAYKICFALSLNTPLET